MITWEKLPLEERKALREAFNSNPDIIHMEQAAIAYQRAGNFIKAFKVKDEINKQWEYVKEAHLNNYMKTVSETVKLSQIGLPQDKLRNLVENMLVVFMACDIIEMAHFNANEILKTFNKNYSMDNFQDLLNLVNGVKRHLKFLQQETGYMDDLAWGEGCDKQYEMIRNKAKSIIKKKDNVERWGQNLKKYIDGSI